LKRYTIGITEKNNRIFRTGPAPYVPRRGTPITAGWNIDVEDIGSASQASGKDPAFDRIKQIAAQMKSILKPYWKCFQTTNL
jgi:hypothetical protein